MAETVHTNTSRKEAEATMKELLIELVKERQFLYDKAHKDHFRRNKKDQAWDKIANILDVPDEYNCFLFMAVPNDLKCFVN